MYRKSKLSRSIIPSVWNSSRAAPAKKQKEITQGEFWSINILERALDNRWLKERGVPSLRQQWIDLHYGKQNPQFNLLPLI